MTLHQADGVQPMPARSSPAAIDAAARAVDIVNLVVGSRSGPDELGSSLRAALGRWGEQLDSSFDDEIDEFVALCHRLRAVLELADRDRAAEALNELLAVHTARPRLVREPGWDWHLHFDDPRAGWTSWFGSAGAFALAERLATTGGRLPWGICAEPECTNAFLDNGRRQPQRHCSPRCATRSRVRRHRARSAAIAD
ncbi:MAG: CGNR zinc finger domain-containing protein [Acidimicrobiales bacterium]